MCQLVCVWLVCGGVGARVEVVCCCSLCVSDLGGFGLGREGVFAKNHVPKERSCSRSGLDCGGGHGIVSSEWEGETSTSWTMCVWFEVVSSAIGVGCVGTVLVSDSEVESSMSEGQTSTLCSACKREMQQCSWSELTKSLKHLMI